MDTSACGTISFFWSPNFDRDRPKREDAVTPAPRQPKKKGKKKRSKIEQHNGKWRIHITTFELLKVVLRVIQSGRFVKIVLGDFDTEKQAQQYLENLNNMM